jgi:hypothetical protein
MMAVLERPKGYSLWVSTLLPDDGARWELLDSSPDRTALERQAKGLVYVLNRRRLAVVEGSSPPAWKPVL